MTVAKPLKPKPLKSKPLRPMPAAYITFPTMFGVSAIAWNDAGLCRVQLPDSDEAATARRVARGDVPRADDVPAAMQAVIDLITRHLSGSTVDYGAVTLDTEGVGAFESAVYAALRKVPAGTTTTYGALAKAVGSPGAAQAVGITMSRNPWPVVVPCHRVLGASQAMVGFSAPGGIATKQRLLRLEGIDLDHGQPRLPGL